MSPRPRPPRRRPIYIRNAVEANVLDSILRQAGVPHYIRPYSDASYKGSWRFVDAWGKVECPPEREAQVRKILEELREEAR